MTLQRKYLQSMIDEMIDILGDMDFRMWIAEESWEGTNSFLVEMRSAEQDAAAYGWALRVEVDGDPEDPESAQLIMYDRNDEEICVTNKAETLYNIFASAEGKFIMIDDTYADNDKRRIVIDLIHTKAKIVENDDEKIIDEAMNMLKNIVADADPHKRVSIDDIWEDYTAGECEGEERTFENLRKYVTIDALENSQYIMVAKEGPAGVGTIFVTSDRWEYPIPLPIPKGEWTGNGYVYRYYTVHRSIGTVIDAVVDEQ